MRFYQESLYNLILLRYIPCRIGSHLIPHHAYFVFLQLALGFLSTLDHSLSTHTHTQKKKELQIIISSVICFKSFTMTRMEVIYMLGDKYIFIPFFFFFFKEKYIFIRYISQMNQHVACECHICLLYKIINELTETQYFS